MAIYYSKKDGAAVADIRCYNYAEVHARMGFSELRILDSADMYYLVAHAYEFSGLKKAREDGFKFEANQIVRFGINKKDWKRVDFKTKKEETIDQSNFEKVFCQLVQGGRYNLDTCYQGEIVIDDSLQLLSILKGMNPVTKTVLSPEMIQQQAERFFCLVPAEKQEKLTSDVLVLPSTDGKGGGSFGGGGSKAQSEYDKLSDRFKWIADHLTKKYPALKIETFWDVTSNGIEAQPTTDEIKADVNNCMVEYYYFLHGIGSK